MLIHSQALVLANIVEVEQGFVIWYFPTDIYLILISYYSLLFKGILIPLLMIILCLWTVKNVVRICHITPTSVVPTSRTIVIRSVPSIRAKDCQFLQILFIDSIAYIIFNLMIVIILMYQQFNHTLLLKGMFWLFSILYMMLHKYVAIKNISTWNQKYCYV